MIYQNYIQSLNPISHLPLSSDAVDLTGLTWVSSGLTHGSDVKLDTDRETQSTTYTTASQLHSAEAALLDRSNGWTVSFLVNNTGQVASSVLFGLGTDADDGALFIMQRNNSGIRVLSRDDAGGNLFDQVVGHQAFYSDGLPNQIIWTQDANRNYRMLIDGVEVLSGQYSTSPQTLNQIAFGGLKQTGADMTNQTPGNFGQCFVLNRELEQPELDTLIATRWLTGGLMDRNSNFYAGVDSMMTDRRHAFLVEIDEPCAFTGATIRTLDLSSPVAFRVRDLQTPDGSNDTVLTETVNNDDIFGRTIQTETFSGAVAQPKIYPPGRYWLDVDSVGVIEGAYVFRGVANSPIIPGVKDADSYPRTALVGDKHVHYVASLGSDLRGIRVVSPDGSSETHALDQGYVTNDINHAGGAVLPLANGGFLVVHVGHTDLGIRCNYFADATDLSDTPTNSYTLVPEGGISYPNMVELNNGDVFLVFRGNENSGPRPHSASTVRFNPVDGSNETVDVFVDSSANDWRYYIGGVHHGVGTDGKEYVGVAWNTRSWPRGFHEHIGAAVFCIDDNQWYSLGGQLLGGTANGSDGTGNGRITTPQFFASVADGGCLLKSVPADRTTLQFGEAQSVFIDVSQMPAKAVGLSAFTLATLQPQGGFDPEASLQTLSFDGDLVFEHGQLGLSIGQPAVVFNTFAFRGQEDGSVIGVIGIQNRRTRINTSIESVSSYYIGWGGAQEIAGVTIENPFTDSPTFTENWVTTSTTSVSQIRPIAGDTENWCTSLKLPDFPHPVMHVSDPAVINAATGAIVIDAQLAADESIQGDTALICEKIDTVNQSSDEVRQLVRSIINNPQ